MEEKTQMITRPLETIEGEINFYKQQTAIGILEIGKRLIEAKEQLKEEESFRTWCKKMEFSKSSAYRFIKVATEFTSVPTLGQSKIFALLDVPIEERKEFMSTTHEVNGVEKTIEEMSTRELQQAIKEKKEAEKKAQDAETKAKQLEQQLAQEKAKPKEKEVVTKTVEVDKTDYSLKTELERIKKQKEDLLKEYSNFKTKSEIETERLNTQVTIEKQRLEAEKERNKFLEKSQEEYGDLKKSIELLTEEKDSISRQVSIGTELSGLAIKMKGFIDRELAPISYSRALREASNCDVVKENLIDIIEVVENWCLEMRGYLVNNTNDKTTIIVEGEVVSQGR